MSQAFSIESARPDEWPAAFRFVFQHLPSGERVARVANAVRLVERGELDPAGILVARGGCDMQGALVCQPVPGASGLVWPPQARPGRRSAEVENELLRHACAWLRLGGARLGQALLTTGEAGLAAPLERNGFTHVTSLWYLRHDLKLSYGFLRTPDRLTYVPYSARDSALFRVTLPRTYLDTLDCPEVNGVRTLDEVFEGHRAQGLHDPSRWWLALVGDRPVGVLLLTAMPEWDAWDVSYVGVVPEARRRGWGRELMHRALRAAHAGDAAQLALSVDARNHPAWSMYQDLGFRLYDQREVYLAIWR
jgi:ribosomal protein S18 acetylase RimI-like enzyme